MTYEQLVDFLERKMSMSHVYQPLLVRALVDAGGDAAGQTVDHAHIHLIPRRTGDLPDPRGGVRGAIPEKRIY
jgi:diadenosine tetraphosphate (Ap4A) HIT family hydrolase